MKNTTLRLLVLLFAAAWGCGRRPAVLLHVVATAPSGIAEDASAAIRISFDRPVVEPKQVGRALAKVPINVSPKVGLRAHWLDRQTLVATPATPWRKATRYSVELAAELDDRLKESLSFSFVHDPLDVIGPTGIDRRWLPSKPTFDLVFDQKVKARDVVEHCKLSAAKPEQQVALSAVDSERVDVDIALTPSAPLTQGRSYTLRCEKLLPAEGDVPLATAYEVALDVYPALALKSSSPGDGARVAPDDLTLSLLFSTPVDSAELQKHLRLTPAHPAMQRAFVTRSVTEHELTASFEADTSYTLEVDANLRDRFGQRLGKPIKVSFHTSDASASLSVTNGIFAIETSAAGYPVWSRNVEEIEIACAHVPKANVVKVLTAGISYGGWYDADHPDVLDFAKLGLKPKRLQLATGSTKNKWTKTTLSFAERCGGAAGGLYLAELRSPLVEERRKQNGGPYPYRVLGNITNLGVMLKVGPGSGLVWVAGLHEAAPIEGATITLFDTAGHRVFGGSSDARGLLMLPGSDKLLARDKKQGGDIDPYATESETYRDQRLIAIVEKDGDMAVVDGNWSDGIEAWNFNVPTDRSGGEVAMRGFLETDRGIYRPGETVHFKGLAREVPLTGEPRLPSAKQLQVRVEDGNGAELHTQSVSLSEFGGFNFDFKLDPEARTGDYYVVAKLGKQSFRQSFSVEEFRPVSFEITTRDLKEQVRLGSPAKIALEARYLFGAPVSAAYVSYEVQRRRHWLYFPEHMDFSFEDWSDGDWSPWWEPDHYTDFVSEGEGRTDEKGRYAFSFKDEAKVLSGPQTYLVRTSVRDATDQEVTKRIALTAHKSDLYVGVALDSWVGNVGKPIRARIIAVDPAGKPLVTKAKLSIERVEDRCGIEEGPYGYWRCERKRHPVSSRDLQINASAPASELFTLGQPGEHLVRVEARDARGTLVKSSASVWVIGPGESSWGSDDSAHMALIPGKRSYKPGETALLVPEAATDGATMLVTLERNGIIEARLERGQGTTGIQIPIAEAHAPNVFVSVALIRGRRGNKDSQRPELKLGMVNLPVSIEQRALSVQISTEGSDFEPGQPIKGKVRVTGRDGAPVRAEVALSAADEGVLQLIAYQTPNPSDSIYAPWGLGVQNATNWNRVAKLDDLPEDEGEEGADSSGQNKDEARSRFVASAYWAPALVTDAAGEASFAFEAPDNLTAFRLMAAVADVGGRFGSAEQRVRVRKDLLVAPIVPRFLMADDQIELGAVVHNYTDQSGEVEVSFDIAGAVPRKKTLRAKVAAQGKAVLRVPVKIQAAEQATFQVDAALLVAGVPSPSARDALKLVVPIERAVVKDAETLLSGRAESAKATLEWHRGIDEKASALEVLVDRTGIADLGPSLKYLVQYPYGCLEQTMSGLLPLLKVRELAKTLALSGLTGEKLDTYIQLGVSKVIRHQQADGHFSLWPDSQAYPHLTVYALWGLNEARKGGVRVEKRALDLGLSALRSWVSDGARTFAPDDETGTLAMAAFVMAELGAPDHALNARLLAAKGALPVYGKAFLLRAMRRAKAAPTDQQLLLTELTRSVRVNGSVAEVDDPIAPDTHYFSSASRSMALVVAALLEADPRSALIEPLILGLKARRQAGRWESTQENVYGLLALADYARSQAAGKAKLTVLADAKPLLETTILGSALARVRIPLDKLPRGSVLSLSASEPVFYNAVLYKVRPEPVAGELDHGFSVKREYLELETERPVDKVKVGQLVKVRLHLATPQRRRYVAVTDPLPAGFESINSTLKTERDVAQDETRPWFWDHRSLRDERTDWFIDSLPGGTEQIEYVLRATHAGTFSAPPARAEAMYQESVMGHSQSHLLTVVR